MERPTPLNAADFAHFTEITTRWNDNDAYGHINNVVYYEYFDTAVNFYLITQGGLDIANGTVIGLMVETHCNYFKAIAYPDKIRAGLRVKRLGTSSVTYEIGIFRNDETVAAAQGHAVHVFVDRVTNRPVPLPEVLKKALEKIRA
ncbi:MAG: thioesterase family protein [Pseudolabrys sp.]|nr:thioesterase family protein [Pseudolabrys sp.]MDP2294479.1 thioesterase family protein [Pseudolabrys sp.]